MTITVALYENYMQSKFHIYTMEFTQVPQLGNIIRVVYPTPEAGNAELYGIITEVFWDITQDLEVCGIVVRTFKDD